MSLDSRADKNAASSDVDLSDLLQGRFSDRNISDNNAAKILTALFSAIALSSWEQERESKDYWIPKVLEELANVSGKLLERHPNTRFISIGNSPSYVVYGVQCLAKELQEKVDVDYVPFSGRYMDCRSSSNNDSSIYDINTYCSSYDKSRMHRTKYREMLSEVFDLNPQNILKKFRTTGSRTAIIDNMQSGESFTSFIHFMYEWAQDVGVNTNSFGRAFKCIALIDSFLPATINIPEASLVVPIARVRISPFLRAAINGNLSKDEDRFVPHYPPTKWHRSLTEVAPNTEIKVARVKRLIEKAIGDQLRERPIVRMGMKSAESFNV